MDRDYGRELDELRTEIAELQEVLRSLTESLAEERGKPHAHGPHEQEGPHGREAPGGPGRPPEDGPHGGRRDHPGWDTPPRPGPHVPGAERGPRGRFLDSREERWAGKVRKMPHMHPDHNVMALLDDLENEVGRQSVTGAITYLGVYTSGGQQSTWIRRSVSTDGLFAAHREPLGGARPRLHRQQRPAEPAACAASTSDDGGAVGRRVRVQLDGAGVSPFKTVDRGKPRGGGRTRRRERPVSRGFAPRAGHYHAAGRDQRHARPVLYAGRVAGG